MTYEEIIQALRYCKFGVPCEKCPVVGNKDCYDIVDMARYFPSDGWTCDNWEVPQNLITHWMPLPEAPEAHNGKENS